MWGNQSIVEIAVVYFTVFVLSLYSSVAIIGTEMIYGIRMPHLFPFDDGILAASSKRKCRTTDVFFSWSKCAVTVLDSR